MPDQPWSAILVAPESSFDNGSTGYVFAPADDVQLAEIFHRLVSDPGHGDEMGQRGYKKLVRDLSEEVWLTRVNSVLSSALV